jgi:hypothetical protein
METTPAVEVMAASDGTAGGGATPVWSAQLGTWVAETETGWMSFDPASGGWQPLAPAPSPAPVVTPPAPFSAPAPARRRRSAGATLALVGAGLAVVLLVSTMLALATRTTEAASAGAAPTSTTTTEDPTTSTTTTTEDPTTTSTTTTTTEAPTTTAPEPGADPDTSAQGSPLHPVLQGDESMVVTVGIAGDRWGPTDGTFTLTRSDGHVMGSKTGMNELSIGVDPGDYVVRYQAPSGYQVTGTTDGPASSGVNVHVDGTTTPVVSFTVARTATPSCSSPIHAMGHPTSC